MTGTVSYLKLNELNANQLIQYRNTITYSFPKFLFHSKAIINYWPKLEAIFPDFQIIMVNTQEQVMGIINSIPIYWNEPLTQLPDDGWDWLLMKGIHDYEQNIKPNCLGALQIIVNKNNLGKGYSKLLLTQGKLLKNKFDFENFIIPIRPTYKYKYPKMKMKDYMSFKMDNKIYDPWIRTHLNNGAEIIKICHNAMNITGEIEFWEETINQKITKSGFYIVEGALNPVFMHIEKNEGEYREENIWISYP